VVASRVIALAVFATLFPSELFIFMGLHWGLMVVWIVAMVKCYADPIPVLNKVPYITF
jgi:hypothetical protein